MCPRHVVNLGFSPRHFELIPTCYAHDRPPRLTICGVPQSPLPHGPRILCLQIWESAPQKEHEACHLFIQEASTRSYTDSVKVVNRIARILRVGKPGGRGRAVVAGDEESFRFMYRLRHRKPADYMWLTLGTGIFCCTLRRLFSRGTRGCNRARG